MKNRTQKKAVLLTAALFFFVCAGETSLRSANNSKTPSDSVSTADAQSPQTTPGTPAKLALLVGINNYKYSAKISALAGSINDVEDMRRLLIGKFEFPPENILVLTDAQATHDAIISAIHTHLIAKARPGDIVVFHYSGHGSQMKDVTGKMISGMDETIVPYDSRDPAGKVFDISGAELHPLLVQLATKTKNLTFVLDSCHSGTLVRGARVRSVAADTRTPPPLPAYSGAAARELGAVDNEVSPKFASITAATSRESAFEHFAEGRDHGALTYFLTRQLSTAKAGSTYRDVMDNVAGNVTANYPMQHPSLEGAEADQYVFGDGSSLVRAFVPASPSQLTSHRVTLAVGEVQGATVGSAFDVYPPGSRKFAPPDKPTARVRISTVGALSSEATMISGGSIVPASRAVEREHQYGKLRMRVFFDHLEASPVLQAIKEEVQALGNVEVVDTLSVCNIQLKQSGSNLETLGADSTTLSIPVPANEDGAVERVVSQIKAWAKWFNLLSIRNPDSEIEVQFTLKGSQTRDPMAHVGRPDMGLLDGETVEATLTNDSERDVYVAILDLSSDGSVAVVYPPEQGTMQVLKPGLKLSRSFITFVPQGRSVVTDILKVFAAYKPFDLRSLTQDQIRGIEQDESDPLQAMLNDSADGSRGVSPVLTKPVDLGAWNSMQRVLVVRRR